MCTYPRCKNETVNEDGLCSAHEVHYPKKDERTIPQLQHRLREIARSAPKEIREEILYKDAREVFIGLEGEQPGFIGFRAKPVVMVPKDTLPKKEPLRRRHF